MVGVDISPTSVKLLELSKQGHGYRVEAYGVAPLVPDSMIESDVKDIEAVGKAVALVVGRSRTTCKNAIIAVPGSSVITKVIQLDAALEGEELEAQVHLEGSRYIPYPMEEVSLDYQIMGVSEKKHDKMDVFVAASRMENVHARVEALKLGGLNTLVADVETYAIERAVSLVAPTLPNQGENKTIAVIDIGSVVTSITVFALSVSCFSQLDERRKTKDERIWDLEQLHDWEMATTFRSTNHG